MATDALPLPDALPHEAAPHAPHAPHEAPADGLQKPVKRSWRRKYRKMRHKFEETMTTSNQLITDEYRAMALARRLQEQNDQILELLLDLNESTRLPANLRLDLRELAEVDAAMPSLEVDPDPDAIHQELQKLRIDLSNGLITAHEYAHRADQLHTSRPVAMNRTLASLVSKVPHTVEAPNPPIDGLDLSEHAPGYMSPSHEEEYLLAMDVALADPTFDPNNPEARPLRLSSTQAMPSEKELTLRNPDSVYNWLRKYQPQVFLQDKDKDPAHPENLSEKSAARAGNAGGRGGKRQSNMAGTPGPKTDHEVEDDGFIPETGTGSTKGRRGKGAEDDSAYRPKGGSSRPAKRKREDGDTPAKGGRKKNRPSVGAAS